jgi:cytochrome P450
LVSGTATGSRTDVDPLRHQHHRRAQGADHDGIPGIQERQYDDRYQTAGRVRRPAAARAHGGVPAGTGDLIERGYREHGKIFSVKLPGRAGIVMLGPEHGKFLFDETDKRLSIRKGYPFLTRMLAPDAFFLAEYDEYGRQREIVLPRFRSRQMEEYVRIMERHVTAVTDELGDQGELDLATDIGSLLMRIVAECFLGAEFATRLDSGHFRIFREFTDGIDPLLPYPRRPAGPHADDAEATYPDGQPVPDRVRVNLILMLMVVGHDTSGCTRSPPASSASPPNRSTTRGTGCRRARWYWFRRP